MILVEIITSLLFIVLNLYLLKVKKINYVPFFIINNVLMDVVMGFLSPGEVNTAQILSMTRAFINIIAIVVVSYNLNFKNLNYGKVFYFFIIVLVFTALNSSDYVRSYSNVLKIIIYSFMFGIGYAYIKRTLHIEKIFRAVFISMIILNVNFFLANLFKIGRTSYSDSIDFYAAGIHIGALNTLIFILLSSWFINYFNIKFKRILYFLSFVLFIFMLISLKRSPIFLTVFGFVFLLFFSSNLKSSIKNIVLISILTISLYPIYGELLENQFMNRKDYISVSSFENESRYQELIYFFDESSSARYSLKKLFFGSELFNSAGNYANGIFGLRELHTDHAKLLYGAGYFGFFIYMYTFFILFKYFFINKRLIKISKVNINFIKNLNLYFFVIVFSLFFVSFSEGLLAVTFKALALLLLGSFSGFINSNSKLCVE